MRWWHQSLNITSLLIWYFLLIIYPGKASAQIVPDASLGTENSVVNSDTVNELPVDRIDGGAIRSNNLFHSFQEFNIPEGRGAYFSNPHNITNILTRITGTNPSNIFGTLGVLGNANLFLINPNGIVFGPNSRLDIRGSFFASSASGIAFDGFEFSTLNPQAPPLLTVNIPLGLRFRDNPGSIVVNGPGHNLGVDPQTGTFDYRNRPAGLQVDADRTLALIGGDVTLIGGNLTASAGRIELGSVAGSGLVNLNGFTPDYTGISNFGNIRLAPVASVTTRGESGGAINLQGRQIAIANGSIVDSSTLAAGTGGNLTLRATEAVELSGTIPGTPIPSFILAQVQLGATSRGGDITIETKRLQLTDGAQISAVTFGQGDAGNLTVRATETVELLGGSVPGATPTGLLVLTQFPATGRAGDLTIETSRLLVTGGAAITNSTFGQADAGSLTVLAETIEVLGTTVDERIPSGLFSEVDQLGTGNAGNLRLETERLLVTDGAQIGVGVLGQGNGGNLTVKATEVIELRGTSANELLPSGLFAELTPQAIGKGGNITLETQRLLVTGGAQIRTATFGQGDAGSLTVLAQTVEVSGSSASDRFPSALSTGVGQSAIGNSNELLIQTQRLLVTDGAQIGSGTEGQGNSANVIIRAQEIELRGKRPTLPFSSGLFATVEPTGRGTGGNLSIETDRLQVTGGAKVEVATFGQGDAGNLSVLATESILLSDAPANALFASGLYARVVVLPEFGIVGTGRGGTLAIATPRLQVENGATITVSDESGVKGAGNLQIDADTIGLSDRAIITAETAAGEQGNITLNATDIQLRRNSRITTDASATATGGNININSDILLAFPGENSDITANAVQGAGGRIEVSVPNIFGISALSREQLTGLLPPESTLNPVFLSTSDITAISEAGSQLSGQVIFSTAGINPAQGLVELPQNVVDPDALIAANPCVQTTTSELVITGRGGLPVNPAQPLGDDRVQVSWSELPSGEVGQRGTDFHPSSFILHPSSITPATGWTIDERGRVTLRAYNPNPGNNSSRRTGQAQVVCHSH